MARQWRHAQTITAEDWKRHFDLCLGNGSSSRGDGLSGGMVPLGQRTSRFWGGRIFGMAGLAERHGG